MKPNIILFFCLFLFTGSLFAQKETYENVAYFLNSEFIGNTIIGIDMDPLSIDSIKKIDKTATIEGKEYSSQIHFFKSGIKTIIPLGELNSKCSLNINDKSIATIYFIDGELIEDISSVKIEQSYIRDIKCTYLDKLPMKLIVVQVSTKKDLQEKRIR